jgi:hypothetical protein
MPELITPLVNLGAVGIILALFALGYIIAKPLYDKTVERAERAEQRNEDLTKDVMEKVNPVLQRAIDVISERTVNERDLLEVLTDVRRLLEQRNA